MKNGKNPDPNVIHPVAGYDKEIYVKPTITNPNIIVGDFTYIADSEFESHVTNFYPWSRDKLIIGKFCQIAAGVEFVMNDANHQMNAVSTFPFYTLEGWEMNTPDPSEMPFKGGKMRWFFLAFISATEQSLEQIAWSGVMSILILSLLEILQNP